MLEDRRFKPKGTPSEWGFAVVFACFFLVVALWPLMRGGDVRYWALGVSTLFIVVGYAFPKALRPLNLAWAKFGELLGAVTAPVVMGVIFIVAVTPTALIARMLGKDSLNRRFLPQADSYWVARNKAENPIGSMRNQF